MDQPTGILGIDLPGDKTCRTFYPFETLQIARGVITLSVWGGYEPEIPIPAMIFKLEDFENVIVVELMAQQQALRTPSSTASPVNSET